MFRVALAVAVGLGLLAAAGRTAPPPEKPADADPILARSTDDLVKDLGAGDYRTREKAGKELSRRGEAALPELRAALLADPDAETGRRMGVLVRRLEYAKLVAPKLVTLHLKDRPVKEAMEGIGKQTGYRIDFSGGRDAKYTFDLDNVPFWQAIDAVANAAGLVVYAESDEDGAVRAYEQDQVNPHVAYAGPFRFLATNISSNRNIQLSGLNRRGVNQRQNEYINLNFQIQAEPKTPILGTTFVELTAAVDDLGSSLVPPPNDPNHSRSGYYGGGYRGYNVYGSVNLVHGAKGATTVKYAKGKAGVILLSGTRPEIVIPAPVGLKDKKVVGKTVEIDVESVTENADQYAVHVTVKKLGGTDRDDYSWSNNVWQKLEMQDEKGQKLKNQGANNQNNTPNSVQLQMTFSREDRNGKTKPGKPMKLIFNEWLTVVNEVTFEFKELPLP